MFTGEFCVSNFEDFLAAVHEVCQDLDFQERTLPCHCVDGKAGSHAKDAVSELAFRYLLQSHEQDDGSLVALTEENIETAYKASDLDNMEQFPEFYKDLVEVIINDMVRGEMWTRESLRKNQASEHAKVQAYVSYNPKLDNQSMKF